MQKTQILNFIKNPRFILVLILTVFFLKGVFLATIHPIFDGQDEARHYATIQYLAESEEKNWKVNLETPEKDRDDFETYRFSEELKKTATAAQIDILRSEIFNTIDFSKNYEGKNETEINSKLWKPINYYLEPDIVSGEKTYHKLGSFIEKSLQHKSILIRFFTLRIFSVIFGVLAVFLAYLIFKNSGFSEKKSLILTAILSFQPKFSDYFTNINYDVFVILAFFAFTFFGILILKNNLNWKNFSLAIFSIIVALSAKSTGAILILSLFLLLFYYFYKKIKTKKIKITFSFFAFIGSIFLFFSLKNFLPLDKYSFSFFSSIGEYFDKSFSIGKLALSSRTYWGVLSGWTDNFLLSNFTNIIWIISFFSLIGLLFYFFSKETPRFLPEKKYVVFFLFMLVILQLGIRIADWAFFIHLERIELGTPGRYFLPNLASHLAILFVGLGMLFEKISTFKNKIKINSEKYFEYSLITGLVFMFSVSIYLIFNVIIYRFYL